MKVNPEKYPRPSEEVLKKKLNELQYQVTQQAATERPFAEGYWNNHEPGLYVDIVTGEPLFTSIDKFDSNCGWPSFTQPVDPEVVQESKDLSHGMSRVEIRSRAGNSHLGHVFTDGPKDRGGLRYCINSAALRFIPVSELEKEGYGDFLVLFDAKK